MRLRGLDDETAYASRIRDHLVRHNGHPPRLYRDVYDRRLGDARVYSLRP